MQICKGVQGPYKVAMHSKSVPFSSGHNEGNDVLYYNTRNKEWLFSQPLLHSSMGLINRWESESRQCYLWS